VRYHFYTRASVEIIEGIEVWEIRKIGPRSKVGKQIEVVVRIRISQAWVTVVLGVGIVDFPSNGSPHRGTLSTKYTWMFVGVASCHVLPVHVVEKGHYLGIYSEDAAAAAAAAAAAGIGG
jgi:hypothetical protein